MSKQDKIFDIIQESILIECSTLCGKCKTIVKGYNVDDFIFTEKLISKGWTVKRNKIICGDCNLSTK